MARVIDACEAVMLRPWEWGRADCCTAACDVFMRLHGLDPMQPLRGRYSTRLGALRLIAQEGGWEAMAARLAARVGLVEGNGGAGEIGLVVSEGQPCLAISTGRYWAGKSVTGMALVPEHVRSWRVA